MYYTLEIEEQRDTHTWHPFALQPQGSPLCPVFVSAVREERT